MSKVLYLGHVVDRGLFSTSRWRRLAGALGRFDRRSFVVLFEAGHRRQAIAVRRVSQSLSVLPAKSVSRFPL